MSTKQRNSAWMMAGLMSAMGWFGDAARAGDGARPNLLIMQTDEHNFRTLGCYRATLSPEQAFVWGRDAVVETPYIDWLADHGALCTSFYATTPVCSPSRAAFVSGKYPHNTPVVTNGIPLDDDIVTFAEVLRRDSYATGYAGKWHLDGQGKPQWAPKRKFGFTDNRYMYNRGHWKQLEDTADGPRVKARKDGKPTYGVEGADEKSFTTDFLADRTVEFLRAHRDKPFCYMVSLPDPHGPDTVRAPYDRQFQGRAGTAPRTHVVPKGEVPKWAQPTGKFQPMSKYFGMVKCIDDNVGKIVKALRETGQLDRTIVVFTADHGDLRGEHHRQNKGVPFEGSAKIPFIICYPGKIKPGTVVHEALSCVDFLPTVLALTGHDVPPGVEGRDASALFLAGPGPADWGDICFIRSTGTGAKGGWLAAVTTRHKLVLSSGGAPWLFDLEKDPDERTNFYSTPEYEDTVRDLSRRLLDYSRRSRDPFAEQPRIRDALTDG